METDYSVVVLPCVIRGLAKGHSPSTESHYIPRRRFINSQKQETLDPISCGARQVHVQVSKVRFTLEQAMKTPKCGKRYSCTLSLTSALDMGG